MDRELSTKSDGRRFGGRARGYILHVCVFHPRGSTDAGFSRLILTDLFFFLGQYSIRIRILLVPPRHSGRTARPPRRLPGGAASRLPGIGMQPCVCVCVWAAGRLAICRLFTLYISLCGCCKSPSGPSITIALAFGMHLLSLPPSLSVALIPPYLVSSYKSQFDTLAVSCNVRWIPPSF